MVSAGRLRACADLPQARELRFQMLAEGDDRQDAFSTFWLEVDEMCASCLVRIAACKVKAEPNLT